MAKLSRTVNDDGNELGNGTCNTSSTTYILGNSSTQSAYIAFRFTNVTIPQGSTIRNAMLKVQINSVTTAASSFQIVAEAADNASALGTSANNLSTRSKTTASRTFFIHDMNSGVFSFDVTNLIQEVVNRAGFASGNAINVMIWNGDGLSLGTFSTVDHATDPDPKLEVIYGDNATSACYPTAAGTGTWVNPTNAGADDATTTTTDNSPTAAQIFQTFNIPDLSGASSIEGVLVELEGLVTSTASRSVIKCEVSWDGGTTWSTAKNSMQFQTTDAVQYYGGSDAWSHDPFTASELNNTNFKVRMTNDLGAATNDTRVDYIRVIVFYTGGAAATGQPTTKRLSTIPYLAGSLRQANF